MMAWGVEARVPFLGRIFLETAMSVDPTAKRCGVGASGRKVALASPPPPPPPPTTGQEQLHTYHGRSVRHGEVDFAESLRRLPASGRAVAAEGTVLRRRRKHPCPCLHPLRAAAAESRCVLNRSRATAG